MKGKVTPPVIHTTNDYAMFGELEGNREVAGRAKKIGKSIDEVGYIPVPIVVNEKYEIIDGNGRFSALKERNLPVYYIVVPGLTLEHCISMNINSTNWTMRNFVDGYAKQGNANYVALKYLIDKHPTLSLNIICAASTNAVGGSSHQTIKAGNLVIDSEAVFAADKILTWVEDNFLDLRDTANGRFETLIYSLIFIYKWSEADINRVVNIVRQHKYDLPPATTVKYTLEQLSKLYNKGIKKNFVYFNAEYDKWCCDNVTGYKKRWSVA